MSTDAFGHFRVLETENTFTVTDAHLKLLSRAYIGWDDMEFGAPSIDPKRPYGNSDVLADIAEVIYPDVYERLREDDSAYDDWFDAHADELTKLHAGTGIVLQIALQAGEFKTGTYRKVSWSRWELVSDGEAK